MPGVSNRLRSSRSCNVIHRCGGHKLLAKSSSFHRSKEHEKLALHERVLKNRKSTDKDCYSRPTLLKMDYDENDIRQFRNKLAPFWTMEKPTCGVRFSRETNNRRNKLDIEPSNLVRWRRNY